jgi:hypothetical protein
MDMKHLVAAMAVIRDSENLIINLRVSIRSSSPERRLIEKGLVPYLKAKKQALFFKLFLLEIRVLRIRVTRRYRTTF